MIYTCAVCEGTFESGREDNAVALAEKNALWGDVPMEECDVVCDDCWQKIDFIPIEKPRVGALTEKQKAFNRRLAQRRNRGEHADR
jgi:hypothetical protein